MLSKGFLLCVAVAVGAVDGEDPRRSVTRITRISERYELPRWMNDEQKDVIRNMRSASAQEIRDKIAEYYLALPATQHRSQASIYEHCMRDELAMECDDVTLGDIELLVRNPNRSLLEKAVECERRLYRSEPSKLPFFRINGGGVEECQKAWELERDALDCHAFRLKEWSPDRAEPLSTSTSPNGSEEDGKLLTLIDTAVNGVYGAPFTKHYDMPQWVTPAQERRLNEMHSSSPRELRDKVAQFYHELTSSEFQYYSLNYDSCVRDQLGWVCNDHSLRDLRLLALEQDSSMFEKAVQCEERLRQNRWWRLPIFEGECAKVWELERDACKQS